MSEKRFEKVTPFAVNDTWDNHRPIECASSLDADVVCHYLNEQQEIIEKQNKIIKEQTLRVYCQDQEIQKLTRQLQKIPPNIRDVWLE